MDYNFFVVGGDNRIKLLAEKLKKDGNKVYTFANKVNNIYEIESIEELKNIDYDIVISSVPLSRDGKNFFTLLRDKNITIEDLKKIINWKKFFAGNIPLEIGGYDILKDESTTILNTIPTAEGAIQIALEKTNSIIEGKKALVIGFGRVGKILANKLYNIGMDVYCEARKDTDLAWIKAYGYKPIYLEKMNNILCKMDIIFNTVPYEIMDKKRLILLKRDTLIIDLASAPGGIDYDTAEKLGIKAILALGLPGKYAPDTASDYIKEFIYKTIEKK